MRKVQLFLFTAGLLLPYLTFGQIAGVTEVSLTFTPTAGGTPVVATATDTGGGLTVTDSIKLTESTEYTLSIGLMAGMIDLVPTVQAQANDFLFYFAYTDSAMTSPAGDGNIDNRADPMDYNDMDGNGLPLGLSTTWEPECGDTTIFGEFRVLLAYQAGTKTATSASTDGVTALDLTWDFVVEQDPAAPPCENEEEIITDVNLIFVPAVGTDTVFASAVDPDGPGPLDLMIQDSIRLLESTEYTLHIELFNSIDMEDITEEIMEEDDEHQFFFAFSDEAMTSPAGDGNIDNSADPINYNDFDGGGLPLGLSTDWEAECDGAPISGTFRVVLKHQPDGIKTATSTAMDGDTDIDLTWGVAVDLDPNAPPCENEEEIITDVTLIFAPVAGTDTVFATANDPDGPGPLDLTVSGPISLIENTEYELSIELFNSIEMEDITMEIMEEDDEHQFFFAWSDGVFSNPSGDGNIDDRDDPVNYNDMDVNMLPLGLSTQWMTSSTMSMSDTFRVVLKHQPGIKSSTSTVNDGDTDIDLTFDIATVTSIRSELQASQALRLWPNPASDLVRWEIESLGQQVDKLQVMDVMGRVVLEIDNPQEEINVAPLAKGNYMFVVDHDNKRWVKRFVKL
ncbi:MAG: T9SS type A sorting domain-containing protein [Bacteroidota bacterium]